MIYINYLFIYSLFGFIMESTIYKIQDVNNHSGIFYGPYTFVYGFGVLLSILLYEYLKKKVKIKNKFLKLLFYFIIFTILLTLVEYMGGHVLKLTFGIDMWDYSDKKLCFDKYICLTNSLIWGVLGTFNIFYIYPRLKEFIKKIPSLFTYILLLVFLIDFIITLINKCTLF